MESSTSKMNLVVNGVPITLNMHANLDEIVYKNTGEGGRTLSSSACSISETVSISEIILTSSALIVSLPVHPSKIKR